MTDNLALYFTDYYYCNFDKYFKMPKSDELKCYFKCDIDGPLHRFPKWEYPHTEKFNQWKSVLDNTTQERGNNYIYNSIRICHKHFEDYFKSSRRRLTRNAVPTLNLSRVNEGNTVLYFYEMPPPKEEVNVIPITKVKGEVVSEDENEDMVSCKLCNKSFVSKMALLNHARVEHLDEYMAGEELCVQPNVKQKRKYTDKEQEKIKMDALISSMEPTDIMSLASNDVSYIIISDGQPEVEKWKEDKLKDDEKEKPVKMIKTYIKKEREVKAISGPFECLQPSRHNPEGICHQIFLSCCEYSTHYRDEHTRRRKTLRCQVCEKPLLESDQIALYTCQVCGMGFENTKDLTDHNLTDHSQTAHLKQKPFQCNICQKRYTQQGGLQRHMRMHTGDRPFTCTFCPKSFTQKSGLDQHLRIHTKVKPYRCIICNKSFCQSIHLQQHMRTHTNVAPFQCGICQKRFKQSSHLNYHLKFHNPANMTEEQKQKYAELVQLIDTKDMVQVEIDTSEVFLEQEENVVTEYIVDDNEWENAQLSEL